MPLLSAALLLCLISAGAAVAPPQQRPHQLLLSGCLRNSSNQWPQHGSCWGRTDLQPPSQTGTAAETELSGAAGARQREATIPELKAAAPQVQAAQTRRMMQTLAEAAGPDASAGASSRTPSACSLPGGVDLLSRPTIVLYAGPLKAPAVSEMQQRLPSLGSSARLASNDVQMINLTDPAQAACASSISNVMGTLVFWEDGYLSSALTSIPRGLSDVPGRVVVYGKEGRKQPGISELTQVLGGLQSAGGLYIYNLDGLVNMKGLGSLKSVTEDLVIGGNDGLKALQGLEGLTTVGHDLILNSNLALASVDGLQGLRSVGGQMYIKGNGVLMQLEALKALESVGSQYLINNGNTQLSLPAYVVIKDQAGSGNPPKGASGNPAAAAGYDGAVLVLHGSQGPPAINAVKNMHHAYVPPVSDFVISETNTRFMSTSDAGLSQLSVISGHVIIWDDGTLSDLSGLASLQSISGQLLLLADPDRTSSATCITSFQGLGALQSVGGLNLVAHPKLKDLSGLPSLTTIRGNLVAVRCSSLTSLKGLGSVVAENTALSRARIRLTRQGLGSVIPGSSYFPRSSATGLMGLDGAGRRRSMLQEAQEAQVKPLSRIGSSLWLQNNPELVSLEGLELVEEVFWNVMISSNKRLTSLKGLSSLTKIGGELALMSNGALQSTADMGPLTQVGVSVAIMYNNGLRDLSGLALTEVKGDLVISGNSVLQSLTPLSEVTSVRLNLVVSRNGNLTSLDGLGNVGSVGYHLVVSDNSNLQSLKGLQQLSSIGEDLYIRRNYRLATLENLGPGLKQVGGSIYIQDNTQLASVGQLATGVNKIAGLVSVSGNPSLPQQQLEPFKSKASQFSA